MVITMLSKLGDRLSAFFRATAPDPFVLAVLLTLVTLAMAMTMRGTSFHDAVGLWAGDGGNNGVWGFLTFSMQMCLILVTGHAVAASRPVKWCIERLAAVPRSQAHAAGLVAFVAATLATLNWGLGLIGGALLARDVTRSMRARGLAVHAPLMAAAGYVGLMVWHGGLSGTAPLKVTSAGDIAEVLKNSSVTIEPIKLSETLFSPMNLVITGGLIVLSVVVMMMLAPRQSESAGALPARMIDEPKREEASASDKGLIPRILEDTPLVNLTLAAIIAVWAWSYYLPRGDGGGIAWGESGILKLNPNTVNLTMVMLALILHGSPMRLVSAVEEGARGCAGIILQFPLYAGIMGVMNGSGLTGELARSIAGASNETTLPLMTFLSAGVVNMFVPSGGGQWGVQGPIVVESALSAGVPVPKMIMALAYGDQVTNMLQPFWALPLLAITGCKAREIVGYTAVLMVIAIVWISGCLLVF